MLDYNMKQNPIQGICRIKTLHQQEIDWKIANKQYLNKHEPQFIRPSNMQLTRTNPFLHIDNHYNNQIQLLDSINFSIISIKSPTFSEFFNSVNQQHYFKANDKIDIHNQQFNFKHTHVDGQQQNRKCSQLPSQHPVGSFDIQERKQQYRNGMQRQREQVYKVPTFFIRMPEHFKGQRLKERRQFRNKIKEEIDEELEDIYKGKYKISRIQ